MQLSATYSQVEHYFGADGSTYDQLWNWDYTAGGTARNGPFGPWTLYPDDNVGAPVWYNFQSMASLDGNNVVNNVSSTVLIAVPDQVVAGSGSALYLVSLQISRAEIAFDGLDLEIQSVLTNEPITEGVTIEGQIPTITTHDDGSVWASAPVLVPVGQSTPLAINIPGNSAFVATVTNETLKIFAITNGTAIDLSTNVPEFCVGQQVTFSNAFDPPLPSGTQVAYQWIVWPDFINNFLNPVDDDGSYYPDLSPSLLEQQVSSGWWYSGGNKPVWCKATVTLPNGQTATITAQGNVSIYRPSVEFSAGAPAYPMLYNGFMELGDDGTGQGNMTFVAEITSKDNFYGTANWTQLNNREASYPNAGQDTDGQFWLDNSQFYNDGVGQDDAPTVVNPIKTIHFQDAPGVSDFDIPESITDEFKTYLVFKPDDSNGSSNIWVTLGVVTWDWSASKSYFSFTSTNVTQATYTNSNEFPTWIHTGHNKAH